MNFETENSSIDDNPTQSCLIGLQGETIEDLSQTDICNRDKTQIDSNDYNGQVRDKGWIISP